MKLYDNAFSSCATKVRLALAETGTPFERHAIDLAVFEQKSTSYLAINPSGVLPALVESGQAPVLESHIIVQYLDARGTGPRLAPDDPYLRARMQMWLARIDNAHAAASLLVASEVFLPLWRRLPETVLDQRLAHFADGEAAAQMKRLISIGITRERLDRCQTTLRQFFTEVNQALSGRDGFLVEQSGFTLADLALLPYADSVLHAITSLWTPDRPAIRRWLAAARDRDSYREAVVAQPFSTEIAEAVAAAPSGSGRVET